jgi:hypothetical protein
MTWSRHGQRKSAFECLKFDPLTWRSTPTLAERRHYSRWCSVWLEENGSVRLEWSLEQIRRYYLFHLFLHEVGHINQPLFHDARRREEFAENFALEWAGRLNELPSKHDVSPAWRNA